MENIQTLGSQNSAGISKITSAVKNIIGEFHHSDDSEDAKLKKSTLLFMSFLFAITGMIWGVVYFFNGIYGPATIPFFYGILSLASAYVFIMTKRYNFFRFSQIFLILILPLCLQITLGGFVASGSVILWAILSPIGALVFYEVKHSLIWFVVYLTIVIFAFEINSVAEKTFEANISESFTDVFIFQNIIGISVLIYVLLYYFVSKQAELKKVISTRNLEITQSIAYARRIQEAKLPKKEEIYRSLPNCFVLYKPKAVVSGDFYFFHKTEHSVFIAAADSTGHGVPGALMSMIGSEKLETAVLQSADTAEILQLLNRGIKTSLKQSEIVESTSDGMDIALCSIDVANRIVKFSGANRPLWIIRTGQNNVEEIKATKKAIGGFTQDDEQFSSYEIEMKQGDTFYIFSDGYADTFGGKEGKKLKKKAFKEILLSIRDRSMLEQEHLLDDFIENWKDETEQTDDILVIGVRL
ncbi:PP2C family protein-serine/threonine phosphatase [Aurantibacillus circumpalustris]|uniref:PP2C family protein-serine/threonine phosphatase n=1 Tax=Aurantibacillus circumpalustris TaxID=3036359 RepID=UPI00295B6CE8|nr:SpoIIE family protein phosphatase [Aurantibacillus circumpalustris]